MKNPFTAVGKTVSGMWKDANESDVAPGLSKLGTAVVLVPIVAPITFIAAFFQKPDPKK